MFTVRHMLRKGTKSSSFLVPQNDAFQVVSWLEESKKFLNIRGVQKWKNFSKISIVTGSVVGTNPWEETALLRQQMLKILLSENVSIYGLSTTPFKVSVLINKVNTHRALDFLHRAYGLHQA